MLHYFSTLQYIIWITNCGAVAQLGEHKAGSLGVRGSIPLSSTKNYKGLAISANPFFIGLSRNCKVDFALKVESSS
jgi:hypothetical protein